MPENITLNEFHARKFVKEEEGYNKYRYMSFNNNG